MANFFYTDANGREQGPFNEQQLRRLAARGMITPTTPLETDTGHRGFAEQIPGVFNVPSTFPVEDRTTLQKTVFPIVTKRTILFFVARIVILIVLIVFFLYWSIGYIGRLNQFVSLAGDVGGDRRKPVAEDAPLAAPPKPRMADRGGDMDDFAAADRNKRRKPDEPPQGQNIPEPVSPRGAKQPAESVATNVMPIAPNDDNVYYFNSTCVDRVDGGGQTNHFYIDNNNMAWESEWNSRSTKYLDNVRSIYGMSGGWGKGGATYYFIKTNNELWAMGDNDYGQVGDDTGMRQSKPVLIMKDVANLYFESIPERFERTIYALKMDKSRWGWGAGIKDDKKVYAPVKIDDDFNNNQRLLSEHISMKNGNPETSPTIPLPNDIIRALGSKENIVSTIEIETFRGFAVSREKDPDKSRFYAVTKDGVLWGWGYNDGLLGDGTKAERDKPVKIAENVKRLLPRFFVTTSNDWYLYSDRFNGIVLGKNHAPWTPRIAFVNCLYAYKDFGNAFTDGTWFTPNGKLARSSHDLTRDYEVKVIINNIKLPSIVRAADGRIIAPGPERLGPHVLGSGESRVVGPGVGQVPKSVAGAVSWDMEFKKSGFEVNQLSARSASQVRYFAEFGTVALKEKFEQAESLLRRVDAFGKVEAQKRIDSIQAEIKTVRESVSRKIFYVDRSYSVRDEKDNKNGSGSFAMIIDTPFTVHQDQELQEIHGSFAVPDVTNNGMVKSMIGNAIHLPISGPIDAIKEFARNRDKYQARVWFTDYRYKNSYIQYAEVLKIEVAKAGAVPARIAKGNANGIPVQENDSKPNGWGNKAQPQRPDKRNDAKSSGRGAVEPDKSGKTDLAAVAYNLNFLETFLPKRKMVWSKIKLDDTMRGDMILNDMTVGGAFDSVSQFEQQDWKAVDDQTVMLTFTVNNRNGKQNQAKIIFKTNESYLILDGRRLDQKAHDEFFNTMYNELRNELRKGGV